jgi:7-cyano-7-deazaguanine tRNA-ribosyltransferase
LSFEIRQKDLLGRIGKLKTNHGTLETPALLPVVNPSHQAIPTQELSSKFGFRGLITNSYLVWRRLHQEKKIPCIHEMLKFDGVIETDSGAYQILQYGDVEVKPIEIIRFQEQLESDIAVILDVPTGDEASQERAKWTVDETLRRADQAQSIITRRDILWVGPVQGGIYPHLVAHSAREMSKKDFAIYALGSPTLIMQQYRFDVLVGMILAAKLNLRPDRPLHLFGAGHPMMFALAVALGCDIFDSASYALFARNDRYMTVQGTLKLEDMEYFPCSCSFCYGKNPEHVRRLLLTDRERFLASHNLSTCFAELQTIKQAIIDGRLWELVESRSHSHPALQRAFQEMVSYAEVLERETPIRKRKGPLVVSSASLNRPEVLRHQERLLARYVPPAARTLLLLPDDSLRPFREDPYQESWVNRIEGRRDLHICSYGLAFGVVPYELLDVYPLSQTEHSLVTTPMTMKYARSRIMNYLKHSSYCDCLIVAKEPWQLSITKPLQTVFKRKMRIRIIRIEKSFAEALKHTPKQRTRKRIS